MIGIGALVRRLFVSSEVRAAERRWTAHNREAQGKPCPCGRPSTHVRRHHGTYGSVPHEQWGCSEHFDADGRTESGETVTFGWNRASPCEGCGTTVRCLGHGGPIGGPPNHWTCPVRPEPQVHAPDTGWVNGQ